MKRAEKTKQQLVKEINSLQKQIKKLGKLGPRLENKEKELKGFDGTLMRIYCPKGGSPFELTCKVKHKGKSESGLYRIGVYFPDILESIKEKLSNCIESSKELD